MDSAFISTTETYIVRTYRVDTGEHLPHLDRTFPTLQAAVDEMLAANCKPYTPFISTARKA